MEWPALAATVRMSSLPIVMTLVGALGGVATLWAGSALDAPAPSLRPSAECLAFQIGASRPATTRLRIANPSSGVISALLEFSEDAEGADDSWPLVIEPHGRAEHSVVTPYTEVVRATAWGGHPLVEAELEYEAGEVKLRPVIPCTPSRGE